MPKEPGRRGRTCPHLLAEKCQYLRVQSGANCQNKRRPASFLQQPSRPPKRSAAKAVPLTHEDEEVSCQGAGGGAEMYSDCATRLKAQGHEKRVACAGASLHGKCSAQDSWAQKDGETAELS
ncbi:hypothetical protein L915_12358 [Phytophthora nicotianae]|uniref:Uncharacterized protein n=1 Tax=Phytophthora nicotianae TaxID=4792 RepID=W2GGP2_PHYNI|nr:hypothetical protein L915_12358 [Phytophthora nicotianae]